MNETKILIVEDEPIIARDIARQLRKIGYELLQNEQTGEKALKTILETKPNLVVMDIRLRGKLDGIETAEIIQTNYDIPIIYLTALSDFRTVQRAKQTTPHAYLTKPYDEQKLKTSIELSLYKHKIERRLKISEKQFRLLFEKAPLGYLTLDEKGKILNVNETWLKMLNYQEKEILGTNFPKYLEKESGKKFKSEFSKFIRNGEISNIEFILRKKNKDSMVVRLFGRIIYHEDNEFYRAHCILQNVTEQKEMELILQNIADQWITTFDSTKDSIMLLDSDSNIIRVNKAATEIMDRSFTEIIGRKCSQIFTEKSMDYHDLFPIDELKKRKRHLEFEAQLPNGSWVLLSLDPIFNEDQEVVNIVHVMRNITELKRKENELKQSQEELRNLTIYMDSRMEEDRRRIAREIHDGLGQSLTALKLDMSWLRKRIKQPSYSEKMKEMIRMIDSSVKMVQEISMELRPGILDDLGLISAVRSNIKEFSQRTGIFCRLYIHPADFSVDYEISTTIFRILQEALTNIIRHSKADRTHIVLIKTAKELILQIIDNGIGIENEKVHSSLSFGLIGMRERVNVWNGKVKIKKIYKKGTLLRAVVPI